MYRPETKIEKKEEIVCNKSNQETRSMKTNVRY
jgi:hypothetical protein